VRAAARAPLARRGIFLVVAWLASAAEPGAVARAEDAPPTFALGEDGRIGAFVVAGPYEPRDRGKDSPAEKLALGQRPDGMPSAPPTQGFACALAPPEPCARRASVEVTKGGTIDLKDRLRPRGEALAYASVVVRAEAPFRGYVLLSIDDGVAITLDGKSVLTRDDGRAAFPDDEAVPIEIPAGRHTLGLELHQRDGGWQLGARIVGSSFERPSGLVLEVPGGGPALSAARPAKVRFVRTIDRSATTFAPEVHVSFPEGALAALDTRVRARLVSGETTLYDIDAGLADLAETTRVALPPVPLAGLDGAKLTVRVGSAAEETTLVLPSKVTAALARAAPLLATPRPADDPSTRGLRLLDTRLDAELRDARLRRFLAEGDGDRVALESEAGELDDLTTALGAGRPYERRGAFRHALLSNTDGRFSEMGLYVPPSYTDARPEPGKEPRKHALVVALHGMNGQPMEMVRWFFGKDDGAHDGYWEDRHMPPSFDPIDAFVLAPSGHGNAMYRELGEEDVMQALAWVRARYPIDPQRVSITGPSMGGIGAAGIPLRHPFVFAAAAPLCGYHSTFVRRDVAGKRLLPYERFLGEDRSNADWAANGRALPLYIVHGTQDTPEENSKVLIEKYQSLGYPVKHEHPDLGHNVWQTTYENPDTAKWLTRRATTQHPKWVLFRTARTRWQDAAWVHVPKLERSDGWGEVRAHAASRTRLEATTSGVAAVTFDRDPTLFDADGPLELSLDGQRLTFAPNEPMALVRGAAGWTRGAPKPGEKAGTVTGPFRDVFHEPLLFVYGTSDPRLALANERVARAFAAVRWGVTASYPILSDAQMLARGEPLGNGRALFLVGGPSSNAVTAALAAQGALPLREEGGKIVVGAKVYEGREVGAAYVFPNPARHDRYIAVIQSPTPEGTLRALSLPDFLPDFVVYDEGVAKARGQLVLGAAQLRAAGFFQSDWSLPASF